METLHQQIFAVGDTLDLTTALAATNWNKSATALSSYPTVTDSGQRATLSISATGSGVAIATIDGATSLALSSLLKRRRGNPGGATMYRVGFSTEHNP